MPQYLVLTEVCLFGRLSCLYPQFKIWFTSYINVGKVGPWSFWSTEARQYPTSSSYLTANLSLLVAIIILRVTLGLCRIALWERLFTQFPTHLRNSQWKNGRYLKVLIEVTNFSLLLETGPPFYVATQATRSSSRLQANEVPVILRTLGLVQPRESNPRHPALQSSVPPTALILHRLKEANEVNTSPNVSHNAIRYKTDSVSHTQTNLFSRVLCMTVTLDVLDTHTSLWVEYILSRMASIDSQRKGIFPVLLFT